MKKVVITGGNGFMGNRLVAESLKHGVEVIALARDSKEETAEERVILELAENMTPQEIEACKKNLAVYSYDIGKINLGLSVELVAEIKESVDTVFNIVGDTTFFPKNKKQFFDITSDNRLSKCRE